MSRYNRIPSRVSPLARAPGAEARLAIYQSNAQIAMMARRLLDRVLALGLSDPDDDDICLNSANLLIAMIDAAGGSIHQPGAYPMSPSSFKKESSL